MNDELVEYLSSVVTTCITGLLRKKRLAQEFINLRMKIVSFVLNLLKTSSKKALPASAQEKLTEAIKSRRSNRNENIQSLEAAVRHPILGWLMMDDLVESVKSAKTVPLQVEALRWLSLVVSQDLVWKCFHFLLF
jgi:hypothetical protein